MAQEIGGPPVAPAQSQSLYRKYRPRSFAPGELVGQRHIARTLQNAIAQDRVAHAYLFCGPRGTGKTSTARLLAKAVNCLHPDPEARPCNACAACEAINAGAAVDIIEIDAASNRGVDDIRDLREKVKYAPAQLRVKFYIIDEAHQLTRDAFNAFLKTLEEPPAHVKFVLATTEPDKLPETVASRCQRFDFRRIPVASVVERLDTVSELEGLAVDDAALQMIARQSTGSLRDALGLLEQLALFGESGDGPATITADAVRQVLGLSRNDRLVQLVDALADRDAGAGLRLIAEAAESGEDVHQMTRQLVGYLRLLLHLRAGGHDADADDEARSQAEQFTLADLVRIVRAFSSIEAATNRGSFAQLPLEIAFVETVLVDTSAAVSRPAAPAGVEPYRASEASPSPPRAMSPSPRPRPEPVETPRGRTPSPAPRRPEAAQPPAPMTDGSTPSSHPPQASGPVLERLVASWASIRRDVKTANSRIAALLGSVDPAAVKGNEVVVVTPYEFHRNKLNEESARRVVEDVIGRYLNGSYQLLCVAPDEVPASVAAASRPAPAAQPISVPEPPASLPETASAEPDDEERVRAAKSIFGATEIDT